MKNLIENGNPIILISSEYTATDGDSISSTFKSPYKLEFDNSTSTIIVADLCSIRRVNASNGWF